MYMILGMILGGAIVALIYEKYNDKNEAKVRILLAPKIKKLIEVSSMKIAIKQERLNRLLSEEEKNQISDECYDEI